jgi:hypothetical protein
VCLCPYLSLFHFKEREKGGVCLVDLSRQELCGLFCSPLCQKVQRRCPKRVAYESLRELAIHGELCIFYQVDDWATDQVAASSQPPSSFINIATA